MFTPGQPPSNPAALAAYIANMEQRIAQELNYATDFLRLRELNVEPSKLFDGMVAYADGTNWNPGGGEDVYVRLNGAWLKPGRLVLVDKSADYTLTMAEANGGVHHPSADTSARTFTIPANASVAYPVGTTLTFANGNGAGTVSIAITSDTLRLAGAGTTGTRTLAQNGLATAFKITATEWLISGAGLT